MRSSERDAEARRKAQTLWEKDQQQQKDTLSEKEKQRATEADKIMRLRQLRLAKEAGGRTTTPDVKTAKSKLR